LAIFRCGLWIRGSEIQRRDACPAAEIALEAAPIPHGYVSAQLADVNGDGHLDLILLGYRNAGIEVYFGDGTGNWTLHTTLPETRPGSTMPGRALVVTDLNHDGQLDLVAAFQQWGIYIYSGDGQGNFSGGPLDLAVPSTEFQSLALGDVNKDGRPDLVINGTYQGAGSVERARCIPEIRRHEVASLVRRVESPQVCLDRGRAR
jgi:hypothetical protein